MSAFALKFRKTADICSPPPSSPSKTSSPGKSTTPLTWRYFLPLIDSSDKHRSVSPEGRVANGEPAAGEGLSNGLIRSADGVEGGNESLAKKVTPNSRQLFYHTMEIIADLPTSIH